MSINRVYRVDHHPHIFQNRTRIEVLAAQRERAKPPRKESWWTQFAQPHQRGAFGEALEQRNREREAMRKPPITHRVDGQ